MRFFFKFQQGFDFDGSHFEDKGISPAGNVIDVPLHRHEMSVDVSRLEAELEFSFRDDWDLWIRVPYEIKNRKSSIGLIDAASDGEVQAMLRNNEIHHGTETLEGVSDIKLLVARRWRDLFRKGSVLDLAIGTSLPTGRTEEDTIAAGEEGREHEHFQFGIGTFNPLFELYYQESLSKKLTLGGFALGAFPLYENSKNYRGSTEVTWGVNSRYKLLDWLAADGNFTFLYQGFAEFNDRRDPNSGLIATSFRLGLSLGPWNGTNVNFGVRFPLTQDLISSGEDTLEQGLSFSIGLMHSF